MPDSANTEQLRARLSRIEGQIRGIAKMLESGRTCEDVVTQLMAVRSGIDTVGGLILDLHLDSCLDAATHDEQVSSRRGAASVLADFTRDGPSELFLQRRIGRSRERRLPCGRPRSR